jgi:hypothetical protein
MKNNNKVNNQLLTAPLKNLNTTANLPKKEIQIYQQNKTQKKQIKINGQNSRKKSKK